MTTEALYIPTTCELVEVIDETPTIKTLVVTPSEPFDFRAGQFAQLGIPGVGEAPFTPSSSPHEKKRIEFTVLKTGSLTDRFHECRAGDSLTIRGPFGKGYPMDKLKDKEVLVVGGGVGLAPLRALILALLADMKPIKRMSIKYGARTTEELLYSKGQYQTWTTHKKVDMAVTIDDPQEGWGGNTGVVTTLLSGVDIDKSNSCAFVCGPAIMLRFTTFALIEEGFKPEQIYLSMNRRMSCGMGHCGRCNIGPYYLCKDGPDMNFALIKDYPNVF